jgi:hypothetical protein
MCPKSKQKSLQTTTPSGLHKLPSCHIPRTSRKVVLYCKRCASFIHLTGFSKIQSLDPPCIQPKPRHRSAATSPTSKTSTKRKFAGEHNEKEQNQSFNLILSYCRRIFVLSHKLICGRCRIMRCTLWFGSIPFYLLMAAQR